MYSPSDIPAVQKSQAVSSSSADAADTYTMFERDCDTMMGLGNERARKERMLILISTEGAEDFPGPVRVFAGLVNTTYKYTFLAFFTIWTVTLGFLFAIVWGIYRSLIEVLYQYCMLPSLKALGVVFGFFVHLSQFAARIYAPVLSLICFGSFRNLKIFHGAEERALLDKLV